MSFTKKKTKFVYKTDGCFSLERTLECGQCFRFEKKDESTYRVIASGLSRDITQHGDEVTFHGTSDEEFADFWYDYFDFSRDYTRCDKILCTDSRLKAASVYARGIHILRQDPWETLISFIISQNNNIPRIKGIITRLCALCGDRINDEGDFSFPSPQRLNVLYPDDLAPLRAGFRVKYIMDATEKIASGDIDLLKTASLSTDEARNRLMLIKGVGCKVADCTMLYGMGKIDAFPKDVWIKRAMNALFPDGLPSEFSPIAGIAQQYLFHYIRNSGESF